MRGLRLLPLLLAAAAVAAAELPLHVDDPWIREAPPGAGVAAGYLRIHNAAAQPAMLIGADSPQFQRIEFHESTVRDGMSSMRRLERIEISAGEAVALEPGGRHLMLFGKPPLPRAGDNVSLTLRFADGTVLELRVPVHAPGDAVPE